MGGIRCYRAVLYPCTIQFLWHKLNSNNQDTNMVVYAGIAIELYTYIGSFNIPAKPQSIPINI